jgi:hypothetical protein
MRKLYRLDRVNRFLLEDSYSESVIPTEGRNLLCQVESRFLGGPRNDGGRRVSFLMERRTATW